MQPDATPRFPVIIGPAGYKVLPSGIYRAKLTKIADGMGHYEAVFVFTFQVTEGPFKGSGLNSWINKTATRENGTLCQLWRALTGMRCRESQGIELTDLIGKECFINVERKGKSNRIAEYIESSNLESS